MGDLIKLEDYKFPWREVFASDGPASTLQIYVNDHTGEAEIVQMNDDDMSIRTCVDAEDAAQIAVVLTAIKKAKAK